MEGVRHPMRSSASAKSSVRDLRSDVDSTKGEGLVYDCELNLLAGAGGHHAPGWARVDREQRVGGRVGGWLHHHAEGLAGSLPKQVCERFVVTFAAPARALRGKANLLLDRTRMARTARSGLRGD